MRCDNINPNTEVISSLKMATLTSNPMSASGCPAKPWQSPAQNPHGHAQSFSLVGRKAQLHSSPLLSGGQGNMAANTEGTRCWSRGQRCDRGKSRSGQNTVRDRESPGLLPPGNDPPPTGSGLPRQGSCERNGPPVSERPHRPHIQRRML